MSHRGPVRIETADGVGLPQAERNAGGLVTALRDVVRHADETRWICAAASDRDQLDVLMVNAVFDGMNLVAKEGLVINERDGVLALSENAGAHEELSAVAMSINPFDIEEQAETLFRALITPRAERRVRREIGCEIVRTNNVRKWLTRQLLDIELARGLADTSGAPA
ncbi:MAG: trehalose-6-phosphate synthase [Actinomycetota bacterium]